MLFAALGTPILLAQATTTATRQSNTPPFGIGSTETARITLLNTAAASSAGTAASCTGTVSFLNASGTAVGAAANFTVASGQMQSVSLPSTQVTLTGNRAELRAHITLTVTSGTPCSLNYSLETFDTSTGATHLYAIGGLAGFGQER